MPNKLFSLFLFLLLAQFVQGQNLVPNPSFEDTINCPSSGGGILAATGWINSNQSPDYFNACANISIPGLGVPHNYIGHQTAFDGNAYAGILIYYPSLREFIEVHLTQALTTGTKYFVSAYTSRADSGDTPPSTCSCNNFGFRFSIGAYDYYMFNPAPVNNFSHVHSDSIITDNLNWTRIAGSFIADSAYQYLTLGNFYDDANTDTLSCSNSSTYAYYYVDAVCVSTDSLSCLNWTGINEPSANSNGIYVYPNPVNNALFLGNLFSELTYSFTNISGQKIKCGNINNQTNQIDVSSLEAGIYILTINIQHFKILIIH